MPTINRNVSDGLYNKIVAEFGSELLWWQWVKDQTRLHVKNSELRRVANTAYAALDVERQRILNESTDI